MEAESRSDDAPAKPFYLSCSVCFWDSREIGWCFEKATGLSAQVEALKSNTAEKEFNQLVEHFEGIQKSSLPNNHFSSTFGSLGYSSRSLGRFSSFGMSTRSQLESRNGKQSSLQEYHAVSYVEDSDLASPTPNIQNMIPTRVRLAMKQAKRCRKCRHIMIKPESKAQTIRFKIKLVASNYIPKITLLRTLSDSTPLTTAPYPVNEPFYIGLRFTNPIYTIVNMELSTPFTDDSNPDNPTVDLIASTFALPPYTELWEYEDEEDEDLENKEILAKANNSKGVVEVRGNSVSVIAYVVAKKPSENMILPILVKYNHKSLDVDLGEDEAGDVNDSATSDAAAATAANAIVYGSFWVYINLGRVSQQE
ncbi:hypothetical protein H4219_000826 [Mycoemilia scoparia]|uniref:Dynactin subunit 4 n=1 Tax=Mycoemilia scoparia TaxID=417184 RepID=A0A9W8DWW7_9FUNG|nr:hypothetical protein H4219_000826 [Mycoemilia scoparia]